MIQPVGMDTEATTRQWFDAVRSGKAKEFKNLTSKLVAQSPNSSELLHKTVGWEQNTILHVATRHGRTDMVDAILKINSSSLILNVKNSRDNTPIHVAAAMGHADIVRCLIKHARQAVVDQENGGPTVLKEALCAKNAEGNTPLHEAAKMGKKTVVEILLKTLDQTLLGRVSKEDNKVGETPLSLAVLAKSSSTVEVILDNVEPNFFKTRGPHNHTLLHLTILKLDHATMQVILQKRPELARAHDIKGRTPLHYAAALGSYLLVQTLLNHDASSAYLADDTQMLPVHLAVENNDNIYVIQRFYRSNPSSVTEFTDIRSRNVLHMAAQNGNVTTVAYLMRLPEIDELINSADEDGNTPLHLSAKNDHTKIVHMISTDPRVDVGAINKDDLKARDIIDVVHDQKTPQSNHEDQINSSSNITSTLDTEEALREGMMNQAETLDDILKLRSYPRRPRSVDQKQKDLGMVVMLVATLVTTITFAVVFQIPGGYISGDGSDKGMAVLSDPKNVTFQRFVIFDVMAMLTSTCAMLVILWAFWLGDRTSFANLIRAGLALTCLAILCMALAFAFGMFVVLRKNMLLAVSVFVPSIILPVMYLLLPMVRLVKLSWVICEVLCSLRRPFIETLIREFKDNAQLTHFYILTRYVLGVKR